MAAITPYSSTWRPVEDDYRLDTNAPLSVTLKSSGRHWTPQHPARVWEYTLAARVADTRRVMGGKGQLWLDVGGAGSPLPWLLAANFGNPVQIIDPEFNGLRVGAPGPDEGFNSQVGWMHTSTAMLRGKADFITCISVIEHVDDQAAFLRNLVALLAPGGVLLLTTDYVDEAPDGDVYMFSHMRRRIYTRETWFGEALPGQLPKTNLAESVRVRLTSGYFLFGCGIFGEYDTTYNGAIPELGYSFASLCVRKWSDEEVGRKE